MAEIRITDDGGIVKKVLSAGEGVDTPPSQSQVSVHYTGRLLDGTKFDSSVDRNEPFQFKLGTGSVIKGWDLGVATMTKGEKAILTCRSDYAYGDSGSPPKIPGGATLEFEVELIDWNDMTNVTSDGTVQKKVLEAGDDASFQQPNKVSSVTISYQASLEDGTVFKQEENAQFVITGDVSVTLGLEEAVLSMKKGEKSRFRVSPSFGYGASGDKELGVPADATIYYDVKLIDFEKSKESWEMSSAEKFDEAERCKNIGNQFYKAHKMDRANKLYQQGLDGIKYETTIAPELEERANSIRLTLHNNLAAAHIASGNYLDAVSSCDEALKIDARCIKALFRRAQALFRSADFESALSNTVAALEIQPENASVRHLQKQIHARIRQQQSKERKTFGGIFDRLAALNETENTEGAAASSVKTQEGESDERVESNESKAERSESGGNVATA